jgi:hypothetical protein
MLDLLDRPTRGYRSRRENRSDQLWVEKSIVPYETTIGLGQPKTPITDPPKLNALSDPQAEIMRALCLKLLKREICR